MADAKISALTAATTPLTGTEQVPLVQSGTSKQATVGQLVGSWKVPVDAATTAALTGTVTFSAVAGTLTWTAANVTTLDGVTLAVGSRVLVKNQGGTATNAANGIYTVTAQSGSTTATWTRASASDTTAEIAGAFVAVRGGTTNGGTVWTTSFKVGDTLNTTAMGWYEVLDSSQLSSTNPAALGTAAPGTGTTLARADHVHPTTNLVPTGAITTSGLTQTTARILGRTTASTGAVEEITVGSGLTLSGGTLTASSSSGASLLTRTERTATTASTYTVATAAAPADVDATNLAITFTAPTSGVVKLILSGFMNPPSNRVFFSLRTGTTNVTGTERKVADSGSAPYFFYVPIFLTGLTSGTSYTYKWAWRILGTSTATLNYGTTTASEFSSGTDASRGPLIMEVWSV